MWYNNILRFNKKKRRYSNSAHFIKTCLVYKECNGQSSKNKIVAQSAGVVEYTDCISAET